MSKLHRRTDIILIILTALCCIIGTLLTFSLVYNNGDGAISFGVSSALWKTKLVSIAIGVVGAVIIYTLGIRRISKLSILLIIFGLVLTALTFTSLGVGPEGSDDKAWLDIKGFMTIQPAEILKICFIVSFSAHILRVKANINKSFVLLGLLIHSIIPIGLVCLQGDQGTAVVFIIITMIMLLAGGIKWQYILTTVILSPIIIWCLWQFFLHEHQKQRILVLFNPELDPLGTGYQQLQGKKAIANGGLWGKGLFNGNPKDFVYVSESQNDFIFSYAGQAIGLVGCVIIALLLLAICLKILFNSSKFDALGSTVCSGVTALIFSHSIINIGMVLGFMPVIGIPLPFFSSGGTSIITMLSAIGLVLACVKDKKQVTII